MLCTHQGRPQMQGAPLFLVLCAPCDRAQTGSRPCPVPPSSRARSVQGALLLGLFNISHVVETSLSRRAQGDLTSLYDQIPSTAVIVALLASGAPDMSTASTRPASDVPVGAHMLVRPGQQVRSRRVSTLPNIRAVGLAGLERAPGCACRTARSAGCAVSFVMHRVYHVGNSRGQWLALMMSLWTTAVCQITKEYLFDLGSVRQAPDHSTRACAQCSVVPCRLVISPPSPPVPVPGGAGCHGDCRSLPCKLVGHTTGPKLTAPGSNPLGSVHRLGVPTSPLSTRRLARTRLMGCHLIL